jgi:hypothetical protein
MRMKFEITTDKYTWLEYGWQQNKKKSTYLYLGIVFVAIKCCELIFHKLFSVLDHLSTLQCIQSMYKNSMDMLSNIRII